MCDSHRKQRGYNQKSECAPRIKDVKIHGETFPNRWEDFAKKLWIGGAMQAKATCGRAESDEFFEKS